MSKNNVLKIEYKVFEDKDKVRYLAPNKKIVNKIYNKKLNLTENNKIKTSKTISYLVVTKTGNDISLKDIKKTNKDIMEVLKDNLDIVIKTEKSLTHLMKSGKSSSVIIKDSEKSSSPKKKEVPETKVEIVSEEKIELVPIPINITIDDISSENQKVTIKKEENYLKKYLNYYLDKLEIPKITDIDNYNVYKLSTLGDKLLGLALFQKFNQNGVELNIINSNKVQQFGLASLGFKEFLFVPDHLAGTFFETIYCLADHFQKQELKDTMENYLVNHLDKLTVFEYPKFENDN